MRKPLVSSQKICVKPSQSLDTNYPPYAKLLFISRRLNTSELALRMKPSSDSETKNTKGLAPLDSLLLCLIRRSLFSFRLSSPYLPLSFPHPSLVIPAQAGIQIQLDPQSEALRFRLRMTRGVSFPLEAKLSKRGHSRENGNPVRMDPASSAE